MNEQQQQQQQQHTSNMMKILNFTKTKQASRIYQSRILYYYFMSTCVAQVIGKNKWRENCAVNNFPRFIHPTDESFALLVLENNCERYKDMVKNNSMVGSLVEPLYTTVNRKGDKTFKRGWSDVGKMRFIELTDAVMEFRKKEDWVLVNTKFIIKKSQRRYNKRKIDEDGNDISNKRMNKYEQDKWNNFLYRNMNNKEWINNYAPV